MFRQLAQRLGRRRPARDRPPAGGSGAARLHPARPADRRRGRRARPIAQTRRTSACRPTTTRTATCGSGARAGPEEIHRELEPFRDSDFSRIYWEAAMGDILSYLGRTGRLPTSRRHRRLPEHRRPDLSPRTGAGSATPGSTAPGGDRVRARDRPRVPRRLPPGRLLLPARPRTTWNTGGFYEQHPELRAVNHDRTPRPADRRTRSPSHAR